MKEETIYVLLYPTTKKPPAGILIASNNSYHGKSVTEDIFIFISKGEVGNNFFTHKKAIYKKANVHCTSQKFCFVIINKYIENKEYSSPYRVLNNMQNMNN